MPSKSKTKNGKAAKGRFPNQTKLLHAYVVFSQLHPEYFPLGPKHLPDGFLQRVEALRTASTEGDAKAFSFLLQNYLHSIGVPPPNDVFSISLEMKPRGRGKPSTGPLRYAAFAAHLLGAKAVKLAEVFFPEDPPDKGGPRVRSLIKSAEREIQRKLASRQAGMTPEQFADAATELVEAGLRGWKGLSITKLSEL